MKRRRRAFAFSAVMGGAVLMAGVAYKSWLLIVAGALWWVWAALER